MSEKRKKTLIFITVVFIFLALIGACLYYAVKDIDRATYEERVRSTNMVISKVGNHMNSIFGETWNDLNSLAARMVDTEFEGEKDLLAFINRVYEETGDCIGLIDENGAYFDGKTADSYYIDSSYIKRQGNSFVLREPQLGISETKKMMYIANFETPIFVDNKRYTHVVLSEEMESIDSYFDISNYGVDSLSYIITLNGAMVYDDNSDDAMTRSYNILEYIHKNLSFFYGSNYAQLVSDFKEGVNNTILTGYHNEKYYLTYYHLDMADWIIVLLIPEKNLDAVYEGGDRGEPLMQRIVRDLLLVFLTILLAGTYIVIHMWRNTVSEQRRAMLAEKETSIAKTNFLSSMSHDIRTPMNAIVGMTEIALHEKEDPQRVLECLEKIQLSSNHLLMLINDILDISKIESGKMFLNVETFSLTEITDNLIDMIRPRTVEKKVTFLVNRHDILQDVLLGDALRLSQICINLLSNAVKYTDTGGKVQFELFEENCPEDEKVVSLTIVVSDDGIGMSDTYQEVMYDTFSRALDSRVNQISGSGLGLAICKQMVDLMGGTIHCDSKLGVGTTITVKLLLQKSMEINLERKDSVADKKAKKDEASLPENLEDRLKGIRVLVAEDNVINWEILEDMLTLYGIYAERAENGKECIERMEDASENYYAAVLMDVRMPVMDGMEATRLLRQSGKAWIKQVPIIAMTADAFAEDIHACLEAGMDEHIAKPVKIKRILQVMDKLINDETVRKHEGEGET